MKKTESKHNNRAKNPIWEKGKSGNPNGRPKGKPNKLTMSVKAAIEEAFGEVGGATWLVEQAKEKPEVFAGLLGKIIPKEVTVNLNANLAAMSEEEKVALASVWAKQMGI